MNTRVPSVYRSTYPPTMGPPFSLDEQGRRMATYPCPPPGCGREVFVRFKGFRVEHLRHVGWQPYRVGAFDRGAQVPLGK
jgi:hypothetical protein